MGASASINRAKNAIDNSDESDNNNDSGSDSGSERVSECGSGSGGDVCPNKTLLLPKSPKKKKKYSTYFTPEELKEIKSIEEMQKKATTFISNHFYYGVSRVVIATVTVTVYGLDDTINHPHSRTISSLTHSLTHSLTNSQISKYHNLILSLSSISLFYCKLVVWCASL
jgi:hypothetical protein